MIQPQTGLRLLPVGNWQTGVGPGQGLGQASPPPRQKGLGVTHSHKRWLARPLALTLGKCPDVPRRQEVGSRAPSAPAGDMCVFLKRFCEVSCKAAVLITVPLTMYL